MENAGLSEILEHIMSPLN